MERDPVKMLELVVGMSDVRILGVEVTSDVIRFELETKDDEASCPRCGIKAELLSIKVEEKVDLPVMGVPSRFIVKRRRWRCPSDSCPETKWLEPDPTG
jgi:DNA-directed RNA polymerase subunit RPC12/RpoP